MTDFQNSVHYSGPKGYPGAIASANPHRSVVSPETGFRVGEGGLNIATFAWVSDNGEAVSNTGKGTPAGFVHRDQQGITENSLQSATMTIPTGYGVTLSDGGDFWAISETDSKRGDAVYADMASGAITTAAPGAAPADAVDTGWRVSQGGPAEAVMIISRPVLAS